MNNSLKTLLSLIFFFAISPLAVSEDSLSPASVAGATTIDVTKAKELFDAEALFIDTRKDSDWEAGRIPGAEHLDVKKTLTQESLAEVAAKDEPMVIYCNGKKCKRSAKASAMAVEWGYQKVYYFRDGFPAWKTAGYPIE